MIKKLLLILCISIFISSCSVETGSEIPESLNSDNIEKGDYVNSDPPLYETETQTETKNEPILKPEVIDSETEPQATVKIDTETHSQKAAKNETEPEPPVIDESLRKHLTMDIDTDLFNTLPTQISIEDFEENYVPEKWRDELVKLHILDHSFIHRYAYKIDEYIIIEFYKIQVDLQEPDHYVALGNSATPNLKIFLSDDSMFFLSTGIPGWNWYWISDGILYVYESIGGIATSLLFSSYNIETGEMIENFDAFYKEDFIRHFLMGEPDNSGIYDSPYDYAKIKSNIPGVTNAVELQEYMLSISDTWYTSTY